MRYFLILQYAGTPYGGWQRQPHNHNTVQECVETALQKLFGHAITVFASGRTDVGVHACGQTVHFDSDKHLLPYKVQNGCNHFLDDGIRVMDAKMVEDDFHARYSAKSKSYEYLFYLGEMCPLMRDRAWRVPSKRGEVFDLESAQKALECFVGRHNFVSYMSSGSSIKSTTRTVLSASLQQVPNPYSQDSLYKLEICANGFLYNMVRKIIAHLVQVGKGEAAASEIQKALSQHAPSVRLVAPACGLYLKRVSYEI